MILQKRTAIEEIAEKGNHFFPDMIKFCVDRNQRIISIDEEMHIDMENELLDNGSNEEDIFGGNIMIDSMNPVRVHVSWEAHPNIERNRMLGTGRGRLLSDQNTINDLMDILNQWIY